MKSDSHPPSVNTSLSVPLSFTALFSHIGDMYGNAINVTICNTNQSGINYYGGNLHQYYNFNKIVLCFQFFTVDFSPKDGAEHQFPVLHYIFGVA